MILKPSELLDKLAQLIPPPKRHRHHYHGALAPNSPLRSKVASHTNQEIAFAVGGPTTAKKEDPSLPFLVPEASQAKKVDVPDLQAKSPDAKAEAQELPKKQPSKASLFRWAMLIPPQR